MRHRALFLALGFPYLLVACEGNPVTPEGELSVTLTLSSAHVHTLSEITFTVAVTDGHGNPVTDFDTLRVERLAEGSTTWRGTDLALMGHDYMGTYTFMSSGDYELRVSGMRHGEHAMQEMHHMAEHLHVGRAHVETGGYRVEFESFPGHIHEGDTPTLTFWVMEADADPVTGERAPISGLAATIVCGDPSGTPETHQNVETEPGVYAANHTFGTAGDAAATIQFTGADANPAEAGFQFPVAHAH